MGVSGGMKCIKFLVFFFNFIFWLCGIALIAVGVYVQIELNNTLVITSASSSGAPIVILAVGVIIFFISFFGCCGAWKENYCMVTTFAILLTLIFLVEIAVAIAGYILKDQVKEIINNEVWDEMKQYRQDSKIAKALDDVQRKYTCCGASNYTDWFNITEFTPNHVPESCCKQNVNCTSDPTEATVNPEGCVAKIETWMKKHFVIVAAVALGIAFFELLGIIFACCLMKGIRSGYEVM
ncbi:CD63 antigen [Tiliqua scincoides]|uniref:CD63 antigen n=1 Tax=Tiliqua scincoides TaxID=71010 RepID=UPI0034629895